MAPERLVAPAPYLRWAVAAGAFFVDHAGDPDADVKAQAEKTRLEQHVAAEKPAVLPVDAAQDPGVGKLILAHQVAGDLPGTAGFGRPGAFAADQRGGGVDVPVSLDDLGSAFRGSRRVVVDLEPGQFIEHGSFVDPGEQPLPH